MKPAHREAGVEANAVARVSEAHPGLRGSQPTDPGAGFALTRATNCRSASAASGMRHCGIARLRRTRTEFRPLPRAGYFSLSCQRKVAKRKALSRQDNRWRFTALGIFVRDLPRIEYGAGSVASENGRHPCRPPSGSPIHGVRWPERRAGLCVAGLMTLEERLKRGTDSAATAPRRSPDTW